MQELECGRPCGGEGLDIVGPMRRAVRAHGSDRLSRGPRFAAGAAARPLLPGKREGLDSEVIETAHRIHTLFAADGPHGCEQEPCGEAAPSPFAGSLPAPADAAPEKFEFDAGALAPLRRFVRSRAEGGRLGEDATQQLILAINELATNSVLYGGGEGCLLSWREADSLVFEIRDKGHIVDPLAGRIRPTSAQAGGRGLWLVNQFCDAVQIRSSPDGTAVRVRKRSPSR